MQSPHQLTGFYTEQRQCAPSHDDAMSHDIKSATTYHFAAEVPCLFNAWSIVGCIVGQEKKKIPKQLCSKQNHLCSLRPLDPAHTFRIRVRLKKAKLLLSCRGALRGYCLITRTPPHVFPFFHDTENKVVDGGFKPKWRRRKKKKRRCSSTLSSDSSGVPLRILLNLQWEQTATACCPQKQGNHSPRPLYTARQESCARTRTHTHIRTRTLSAHQHLQTDSDIRTDTNTGEGGDDSADDFLLLTVGFAS